MFFMKEPMHHIERGHDKSQNMTKVHQRKHYQKLILMAVLSFIAMYVLMYSMVNTFSNVFPNIMTSPMVIMIPHHAGTILMCEEANIQDPEIKKLCETIRLSQEQEISQMKAKLKEFKSR